MRQKSGFIYLLAGGGYHKIGMSVNVKRRIESIVLPFETEIVYTTLLKRAASTKDTFSDTIQHLIADGFRYQRIIRTTMQRIERGEEPSV